MNKTLFFLIITLLIFPSISFASWWQPQTWCTSEIKYITVERIVEKPVEVEKIIEKPVEKIVPKTITVTKTVTDPVQTEKILFLTAQVEDLKRQLAGSEAKITTSKVSTEDADQARKIKIKLAQLDQLDFRLDNLTTAAALDSINTTTRLDGSKLIDPNKLNVSGLLIGQNGTLGNIPDVNLIHRIIDGYRKQLKVELEVYQ